jgi:hypothetical protein
MADTTKGNRIITTTITDDDGGTELFWSRASGNFDAAYDGSLLLHEDGSATFKCWTDAEVPVLVHIAGNRVIVATDAEQPPAPESVQLDTATLSVADGEAPGDIPERVAGGVARVEPLELAHDALGVVCLDPAIRGWLTVNDPRALEQADTAHRRLQESLHAPERD